MRIAIDAGLWFGKAENPAARLLLLAQKWAGRTMRSAGLVFIHSACSSFFFDRLTFY